MKIIVDQEGFDLLQTFADVALKAGGLENINGVNTLLISTTINPQIDKLVVPPPEPEAIPEKNFQPNE